MASTNVIKWDRPCYKCRSDFCDLSCPEQPVQEPPQYSLKAHWTDDKRIGVVACVVRPDGGVHLMQTIIDPPLPVQEPVGWMCSAFGDDEVEYGPHQECENCTPLYTTPPQRKPLDDWDIDAIRHNIGVDIDSLWARKFARAIEAAHGIKEGT